MTRATDPKYDSTNGVAPGHEDASAPGPIDPATGQHASYWVLNKEERAKGFVRPVRSKYMHKACGTFTTMGTALSETYARDPSFYTATFCVKCGTHFPVAEFFWADTSDVVGS
jgi:hypothetical protein